MKANLGRYENEDLRRLVAALELAFSRIRIDDALIIGGGTVIRKHLSVKRTGVAAADYSANPIAANTTATFTITVEGAVVGDMVFVAPSGDVGAGLVWTGYVSDVDEVTVVVGNTTAGGVAPTTSDWRASVWQY
jgi:hypothetical protein